METKEKAFRDAEKARKKVVDDAAKAAGDERQKDLKKKKETETTNETELKKQLTALKKSAANNVFDDDKFDEDFKAMEDLQKRLAEVQNRLKSYSDEFSTQDAAKTKRDNAVTAAGKVKTFTDK